MVYINDVTYEKVKYLYNLYEKYDEYKHKNFGSNYTEKCNTLGQAMNNHNMIIQYYQEDEDLVRKSLIVKRLIEELTLHLPKGCKYTIRELKKSNLEIKDEKEKQRQAEEAKQAMLRKKQEEEAQQEMLRREREEREREEMLRTQREQREGIKSVLVQDGDISGTLRGFGTTENEVLSSRPHVPEERLPENPISSREQPYLEGNIYTDSHASSLELLGRKKGELDQLDVGIHESENTDVHQIVRPGTTGSITDTISGFIRDVEPGPVLGVSGGMGVLFLLFKVLKVL
ncbi:hypothetical protein PVIIG_06558 [Plasmodium vivax India VII]|uniref:VIR protein n=1 Tax=Plasmodium vivax India VII TaxID=1077284 RepID=A0A0J9S2R9_PLAVI|nr:hypothetical protein PVIIG_06558 [Plasmodium vivax India VII]